MWETIPLSYLVHLTLGFSIGGSGGMVHAPRGRERVSITTPPPMMYGTFLGPGYGIFHRTK